MRRLGAVLLAAALGLIGQASAKPRVVSINMCTDQLLLALADPDQILGLSHLSRAPDLSWHWREAARFPALSGQAEDVLRIKPDLVMSATFMRAQTRDMIQRHGYKIEAFGSATTLDEVKAQISRAGSLLQQEARAAAAITRIDAAYDRLRRHHADTSLRILPLERRGWVSGRDSLMTELLTAAGAANLGAATIPVGERLTLEQIIALRPDRLLLAQSETHAGDQGVAFLRHPALAALVPPDRRLVIPDNLTVCGGPMLADALEHLDREIARSRASSAGR